MNCDGNYMEQLQVNRTKGALLSPRHKVKFTSLAVSPRAGGGRATFVQDTDSEKDNSSHEMVLEEFNWEDWDNQQERCFMVTGNNKYNILTQESHGLSQSLNHGSPLNLKQTNEQKASSDNIIEATFVFPEDETFRSESSRVFGSDSDFTENGFAWEEKDITKLCHKKQTACGGQALPRPGGLDNGNSNTMRAVSLQYDKSLPSRQDKAYYENASCTNSLPKYQLFNDSQFIEHNGAQSLACTNTESFSSDCSQDEKPLCLPPTPLVTRRKVHEAERLENDNFKRLFLAPSSSILPSREPAIKSGYYHFDRSQPVALPNVCLPMSKDDEMLKGEIRNQKSAPSELKEKELLRTRKHSFDSSLSFTSVTSLLSNTCDLESGDHMNSQDSISAGYESDVSTFKDDSSRFQVIYTSNGAIVSEHYGGKIVDNYNINFLSDSRSESFSSISSLSAESYKQTTMNTCPRGHHTYTEVFSQVRKQERPSTNKVDEAGCVCEKECQCQTGILCEDEFKKEMQTVCKDLLSVLGHANNSLHELDQSNDSYVEFTRPKIYHLDEEESELIQIEESCGSYRDSTRAPLLVEVILGLRYHYTLIKQRVLSTDQKDSRTRKITFSPEAMLMGAVAENSSAEIKKIIEDEGVSLDRLGPTGRTLLHKAAGSGDIECLHSLIANGADVNVLDKDKFPPLNSAIKNFNFKCAILLVESGTDINSFTTKKIKDFLFVKRKAKIYSDQIMNTIM